MSEYSEYGLLSEYYDRFTDDVPYERWADFFERIFEQKHVKPSVILDLACGTGSLTSILAQRGYDMIGVDQSEDMLMIAQENCMDANPEKPVLLLHDVVFFVAVPCAILVELKDIKVILAQISFQHALPDAEHVLILADKALSVNALQLAAGVDVK